MSKITRSTSLFIGLALLAGIAAPAGAVPTNVAPSGVATSSPVGFGAVAADGNDNNRDGIFGNGSVFHTANSATPAFFQIDLGSNRFIDRVEIFPRTDFSQNSVENFRIEVFNTANAVVFSKDYLPGDSTRDVAWGANDMRNAFGSRVRLTRLDAGLPQDFLTFSEMAIFAQNTAIQPNIALGKLITATDPGGFGAQNTDAIDGDINGHFSVADTGVIGGPGPVYHSGTNVVGAFWRLDLGQAENIDYINLYSRTDFRANSQTSLLEVLADDGVSVLHSQVISWNAALLGAPSYDQTVDLTNVKGRFVRMTNLSAGGDNFMTFAELEVFAVAVPEPVSLMLLALGGGALFLRRRAKV